MGSPSINRVEPRGRARGAVLVLHGGTQRSVEPVTGSSLSWQRGRVLQRTLARRLGRDGVAVWLLRYTQRGWNDAWSPSPLPDARWALDELRAAYDDVPVVLVGHSMGARTGARVADDPSVCGLVALAPWFPPGEPVEGLRGKDLVVAHGRRDRITSYDASRAYVERCQGVCRSATFTDMGPVGHYLLRQVPAWNELAVSAVRGMLPG